MTKGGFYAIVSFMYIRKTTTNSKKGGGPYYTYRLVESRRTEKGVQQSTLLNLGAGFDLPKERWAELTKRIQEILNGQQPLFGIDVDLEKRARRYASRIIESQKDEVSAHDNDDFREVDVNSIELSEPRSVGAEHMILEAARQLDLDNILKKLGFNGVQTAAAVGTIIGRACEPGSEAATHKWLQERSGLGELIDYNYDNLTMYQMYTASDKLLSKKDDIESHLYERERSLFGLNETITLYDLTNTYFEGACGGNILGKNGHSKEKRSDCPLVTLALVLDSSGFPRRSHVYSGNVTESATLSEMLHELERGDGTKATVVMDAGIATEDNVTWLREHKYPYLVVSRKRHREFDVTASVIVKKNDVNTVRVQRVFDEETGETLLYCHSEMREKKEKAIAGRFVRRFEEQLEKLENGLTKKGCLKNYDKVLGKIGRLKNQYSRVSKYYTISVEKEKKGENAVKITWKQQPAPETKDTFPGVYCLRTSQSNWDEKRLWKTYTMLTDLEAVFRSLKSELGLRPIHHQTTGRITGHLFITVLAYHLVHAIRFRLKQSNIHSSWASIRKTLSSQNRVTVSMRCRNNTAVHVRKSTRPEPEQQVLYSAVGLKSHPGRIVKATI